LGKLVDLPRDKSDGQADLWLLGVLLAGNATRTPLLQALNSDLSNNSLHSANETETSSGLCKVFVPGIQDCPAPSVLNKNL